MTHLENKNNKNSPVVGWPWQDNGCVPKLSTSPPPEVDKEMKRYNARLMGKLKDKQITVQLPS